MARNVIFEYRFRCVSHVADDQVAGTNNARVCRTLASVSIISGYMPSVVCQLFARPNSIIFILVKLQQITHIWIWIYIEWIEYANSSAACGTAGDLFSLFVRMKCVNFMEWIVFSSPLEIRVNIYNLICITIHKCESARILSHRLHFIIPFVIEIKWPPIFSPSVSSGSRTFRQRYRIMIKRGRVWHDMCWNRRAGVNKSLNKWRINEAHRTSLSHHSLR